MWELFSRASLLPLPLPLRDDLLTFKYLGSFHPTFVARGGRLVPRRTTRLFGGPFRIVVDDMCRCVTLSAC